MRHKDLIHHPCDCDSELLADFLDSETGRLHCVDCIPTCADCGEKRGLHTVWCPAMNSAGLMRSFTKVRERTLAEDALEKVTEKADTARIYADRSDFYDWAYDLT